MSEILIDFDKFNAPPVDDHFKELHEKLIEGEYNKYLVLTHDMYEDAREHVRKEDYVHNSYNNLPKLKDYEYDFIDDIFNKHLNFSKKARNKAPMRNGLWLAMLAYNENRDIKDVPMEYRDQLYKLTSKYATYMWFHGPSWWKRGWWRGRKIVSQAAKEIPEMVKEVVVPNYVGKYKHGNYGLEEAPKLPGHEVIKTIGKYAGYANTVANLGHAAVVGWQNGLGVIDAARNAIRYTGEKFLKDKPLRWAQNRAEVRDYERKGMDINDLKVKYKLQDNLAGLAAHMDYNNEPRVTKAIQGILTKDPVAQAKKENFSRYVENKNGMSNPKAVSGISGGSFSYNGHFKRYHNRYYYSSYRWRRRPSKKGYRYYKTYKKYRGKHRKYFKLYRRKKF